MNEMIIAIGILIFGMMIGSFLNVVIYRTPRGESIAFPSSHCTSCNTKLKWYHNIPLFSWLFLGGKCAFCKEPISKQYPIVELLTGLLWLALYYKIGLVWYLPFIAGSFTALLALTVIDIKYRKVPDTVNFTALIFALIQPNYINAFINGAIAAGGLFFIGYISSKIAKRDAMGGADVIVAGTMGALLGFPLFFIALFLSAVLGIIPSLINRYWGDDEGVPFIPFLIAGTLIVYLFDTQAMALVEWIIYG